VSPSAPKRPEPAISQSVGDTQNDAARN
jgi:hypothetical protein